MRLNPLYPLKPLKGLSLSGWLEQSTPRKDESEGGSLRNRPAREGAQENGGHIAMSPPSGQARSRSLAKMWMLLVAVVLGGCGGARAQGLTQCAAGSRDRLQLCVRNPEKGGPGAARHAPFSALRAPSPTPTEPRLK